MTHRWTPFVVMATATAVIATATFGGFDDYQQTLAGLEPAPTIGTVSMVPDTTSTTVAVPSALPVTTTATVVRVDQVAEDARCPEWWSLLEAFWPADELLNADRVIWAETRCQNIHRSNTGTIGYGDHGLFQINAVHLDWLADWNITAEDLMVPAMNVVAAWLLFDWAQDTYGCGWQPWYMSTDHQALCDG